LTKVVKKDQISFHEFKAQALFGDSCEPGEIELGADAPAFVKLEASCKWEKFAGKIATGATIPCGSAGDNTVMDLETA
jgi:hypothetical protein